VSDSNNSQIFITVPSDLEKIRTAKQRQLLQTFDGYVVRNAYLDQCTGNWKALCNSNISVSSGKVTGEVPASVLNSGCSGALSDTTECASSVLRNYACGAGLNIAALAFKADPCAADDVVSIVPIIIGVVSGFCALAICCSIAYIVVKKRNGKDDESSYSYDDSDSTAGGSLAWDMYGPVMPSPGPVVMSTRHDPTGIMLENYR
jgi:hypothetical protein